MRSLLAIAAVLLLAACAGDSIAGPAQTASPTPSPSETATPTPTPSATPTPPPEEEVFLPAPDRWIPATPRRLAVQVTKVDDALKASIEAWTTEADPTRRRPPRRVVYQSLYQQRIYRKLAKRPQLARAVVARLEGGLAHAVDRNAEAGQLLRSLVTPIEGPIGFKTQRPESAGDLMTYYKRAQRRFGVDWYVLAAVNFIESKFGRVKSPSSAGAQGPMQFLPSTWAAYGLGGDIHDPRDSIMGAANYLAASGAPGDYRRALFAYNHATEYVDAVLIYARQMKSGPRKYFAYYNWQVFVATTKGDIRLTGPGL